jgi:hypothetical protein
MKCTPWKNDGIRCLSHWALVVPVVLILSGSLVRAAESTTYRCTAKDAVGIEPDGTLNKSDPGTEFKIKESWRIVIDVRTGHISFPESGKIETRVVQKAGVTGDYVLFPSYSFRRKKTAANATTDFIRLHVGDGQQQAIFRAYSLTYLITGTCDVVP